MEKALATVFVIIGLLNFAKEAPELIKSFFKGDMIKNLKPGMKERIEPTKNAISRVQNTAAGAVGGFKAGREMYNNKFGTEKNFVNSIGRIGSGLLGMNTGIAAGIKNKNRNVGVKAFFNEQAEGAQGTENAKTKLDTVVAHGKNIFKPGEGDNRSFMDRVDTNMFQGARQKSNITINSMIQDGVTSVDTNVLDQTSKLMETYFGIFDNDGEIKKYKAQRDNEIATARAQVYAEYSKKNADPNVIAAEADKIEKTIKEAYDKKISNRQDKIMQNDSIKSGSEKIKQQLDLMIESNKNVLGSDTLKQLQNLSNGIGNSVKNGSFEVIEKDENGKDKKVGLEQAKKDFETYSKSIKNSNKITEDIKKNQQASVVPPDAQKSEKK